ncbi:eukaryotic translation initiation factor 3 subunit eif-3 [Anaeramoeba flamelloides]|uniref:Eukaryotic translation initiation factor 3 subunit eif-3 n=1 Tax=Anaeramoeba flamelloides TaxID=1746091 RepID=A0AAV7Z7B3_9EUKA|nr:eukaryotic translation initiation factor 3 subunit eif-3 [Anaeramoeba flamelloides]
MFPSTKTTKNFSSIKINKNNEIYKILDGTLKKNKNSRNKSLRKSLRLISSSSRSVSKFSNTNDSDISDISLGELELEALNFYANEQNNTNLSINIESVDWTIKHLEKLNDSYVEPTEELSKFEERIEKALKLYGFYRSFVDQSKTIAKTIVEELHLPNSLKTYKPIAALDNERKRKLNCDNSPQKDFLNINSNISRNLNSLPKKQKQEQELEQEKKHEQEQEQEKKNKPNETQIFSQTQQEKNDEEKDEIQDKSDLYTVAGLNFYILTDPLDEDEEDTWSKLCKYRLVGSQFLKSAMVQDLYVPLQCVVDHLGFRVFVTEETTTLQRNRFWWQYPKEIIENLKIASNNLNLKTHQIPNKQLNSQINTDLDQNLIRVSKEKEPNKNKKNFKKSKLKLRNKIKKKEVGDLKTKSTNLLNYAKMISNPITFNNELIIENQSKKKRRLLKKSVKSIDINDDELIDSLFLSGNSLSKKHPKLNRIRRIRKFQNHYPTESSLSFNLKGFIKKNQNKSNFFVTNAETILPYHLDEFDFISHTAKLRPELVKNHKTQLSSDLFGFEKNNVQDHWDNLRDLRQANVHLRKRIIPEFVNVLDSNITDPEKLGDISIDTNSLKEKMHEYGINIKLLGLIYEKVQSPYIKELILYEMIARTTRYIFNKEIREKIRIRREEHFLKYHKIKIHQKKKKKNSLEKQYNSFTPNYFYLEFFNTIIGRNDLQSKQFRSQILPKMLKKKFQISIKPEKLKAILKKPLFLLLIRNHLGISFPDWSAKDDEMLLNDLDLEINQTTINKGNRNSNKGTHSGPIQRHSNWLPISGKIEIEPRVKFHLNYQTSLLAFASKYQDFINEGFYDLALESLNVQLAIQKELNGADKIKNNNKIINIFTQLSKIYSYLKEWNSVVICSKAALILSSSNTVQYHPQYHFPLTLLMKAKYKLNEIQQAIEYFKNSITVISLLFDNNHPRIAYSYSQIAKIYQSEGNWDASKIFYNKAWKILEKIPGRAGNQMMIQISLPFANSLFELKQYVHASQIITKVIGIAVRVVGKKDSNFIANCRFLLAKIKFNSNETHDAIKNAKLCLSLGSTIERLLLLAQSYHKSNKYEKAILTYEQALQKLKSTKNTNELLKIQEITKKIISIWFNDFKPNTKKLFYNSKKLLLNTINEKIYEKLIIELYKQESILKYLNVLLNDLQNKKDNSLINKLSSIYQISIDYEIDDY